MKKYVWSEIRVEGGKPFTGTLPHPPANTGAFQNLAIEDLGDMMGGGFKAPEYYADAAVVAYREAATDVPLASMQPKISASGDGLDFALLSDGDLVKTVSLPMAKEMGAKAWIQYEFPKPETIRGLTIVAGKKGPLDAFLPPGGESGKALEASDDGQNYHVVLDVPKGGSTEHTLSFAPVTAKYFRISFKTMPTPPNPFAEMGMGGVAKPPTNHEIAELVLHPGARVNRFEE